IAPQDLARFAALCTRERCPYAVVGVATAAQRLLVDDALIGEPAVDMPMPVLLGKPPRVQRSTQRQPSRFAALETSRIAIGEAVQRLLALPAIASKNFLITIGDRSVGG